MSEVRVECSLSREHAARSHETFARELHVRRARAWRRGRGRGEEWKGYHMLGVRAPSARLVAVTRVGEEAQHRPCK